MVMGHVPGLMTQSDSKPDLKYIELIHVLYNVLFLVVNASGKHRGQLYKGISMPKVAERHLEQFTKVPKQVRCLTPISVNGS